MKDKAFLKLTYDEPGGGKPSAPPASAPRLQDLWGSIRIVANEPTWIPRGRMEDSIALLIDGGTPNLCVYDYTNAQWLFAELSTTRIP